MIEVLLQVSSLVVMLVCCISFICLVMVDFLLDIDLVKLHDSLLQFLVVAQVIVQCVVDIVLELLHVLHLEINFILDMLLLLLKTLQFVFQVLHDQLQVPVYNLEMFDFILHLCLLLVQDLDFPFSWPNLVLQFFDLVIKHKLELLELLRSLAQLINLLFLVSNGGLALLQFTHLTLNLEFLDVSVCNLLVEEILEFILLLIKCSLFCLLDSELVLNQGQITLVLHSDIDF